MLSQSVVCGYYGYSDRNMNGDLLPIQSDLSRLFNVKSARNANHWRSARGRFITTKAVPRIMVRLQEDKDGHAKCPNHSSHGHHGVLVAELKAMVHSIASSDDAEEFEPPIAWSEVERVLMQRNDVEVHRLVTDTDDSDGSAHSVYRTLRLRPSTDGASNEVVNGKSIKVMDRGLNQQIYRLVVASGNTGITTLEVYQRLDINAKMGQKRVAICCAVYELKMVPEHCGKRQCHRLFAGHKASESENAALPSKVDVSPIAHKNRKPLRGSKRTFDRRLERLEEFVNAHDGVVTIKEARRHLQATEETAKGDALLFDAKAFGRLMRTLTKKNAVKQVHYNIMNPMTHKMKTHSVILLHEMEAKNADIVELAKTAVIRTDSNQHLKGSPFSTKVTKQEMKRKLEAVQSLKSQKSLKSRKRTFSEMTNGHLSCSTRSRKRRKTARDRQDEGAVKAENAVNGVNGQSVVHQQEEDDGVGDEVFGLFPRMRRVDWCPFYGYIRPIMSRVRLLHEFLCQFKRNEQMELVDDIEYDESTGLVLSPPPLRARPPLMATKRTSNGSLRSLSFDLDDIVSDDFALDATTSPYHEVQCANRIRYHEGLVFHRKKGMAPLPTQDDQIHHRSKFDLPLRHRVHRWMTSRAHRESARKRSSNTMRHCPFKNLLKTVCGIYCHSVCCQYLMCFVLYFGGLCNVISSR